MKAKMRQTLRLSLFISPGLRGLVYGSITQYCKYKQEESEMNRELWEKAAAFHGHECPGLAIGFKACEAAAEKIGIGVSDDEEIVCITENDACGTDAIQALLSCTLGKGNLLYHGTGSRHFLSLTAKITKGFGYA
jgi:formylmethanofuran dehydrogenase subunit E